MKKIKSTVKYELLQILRQKIFYIILPISMFFLFFSTQRGLAEITLSAYVVQTLIFGFLFMGYQVGIRDKNHGYDQIIKKMDNSFAESIGKIIALWIYCIMINLVLILEVIILGKIYQSPSWLIVESIQYILLYFLLSSMISATLGMLTSAIITSKLAYFVLLIVGASIGPLGVGIFEQICALLNIDPIWLKSFFVWINLGQYNPYVGMNYLYGFEIESKRYMHHVVILFVILALYFIAVKFKKYETAKFKKSASKALIIVTLLIGINTIIYLKPTFVYKSGTTDNYGKDVQDYLYYTTNTKEYNTIEYNTIDSYKIKKVKGKIDLRNHFSFSGDIILDIMEPTDEIVMTLYHGFKIDNILLDEEECEWEQERDVFTIKLDREYDENSTIQLSIDYKGMSSQYFFAGEKATLLPNYYAFLPYPGDNNVMAIINEHLNVIPLVHNSDIDYEIEVLSKRKIYSNLDSVDEDSFIGTSNEGLMLIGGYVNEFTNDSLRIIYTDDVKLEEAIDLTESFNEQLEILSNILELEFQPIEIACFVPIKTGLLCGRETQTMKTGKILYTSLTTNKYTYLEQYILEESLACLVLSNPELLMLQNEDNKRYLDVFLSWYMEKYNIIDGEMFVDDDIKDMTLDEKWNLVKELKELIKGR